MKALDCQGLAGAFHLGVRQAGFEVVAKLEQPGGFGNELMQGNPHHTGFDLPYFTGPAEEWPTEFDDVRLVFGNPPCSGFSPMNTSTATARKRGNPATNRGTGVNSAVNQCMWDLVRHAARVNRGTGPEVLAMESVQQAGKNGRPLMRALRDELEKMTGMIYGINHVFMSGATIGAAQLRRRYFLVLTKHDLPFGVEVPDDPVATYRDAIDDLRGLRSSWDRQSTRRVPSQWVRKWSNWTGYVTDHAWLLDHKWEELLQYFVVGEKYRDMVLRLYEEGVPLSAKWQKHLETWGGDPRLKKSWPFYGPRKIDADRPGYVIMSEAQNDFVHYAEERFLTVRELARLQGFPDDWNFGPARNFSQATAWIGKGVPVQSGRWTAGWVRRSLEGEPGRVTGDQSLDCEREYTIDVTNAYKGRKVGHG